MTIELMTAVGALVVSFGGTILGYYKLRSTQKTWEHEQKISMEKTLLMKRLEKRYALYHKTFKLLGTVRDIEYPKEHHANIQKNKQQLIATADALLEELYGEAGLFMEYETRSLILKTYQASYRFAKDNLPLSELIDSYYKARRYLRKDLEFDDSSDTQTAKDILKDTKSQQIEQKQKKENSIWAKKNILAQSARPGYPNKTVPAKVVSQTIQEWKDLGIKSIICLLSDEEIQTYYTSIKDDLITFYEKAGFNVLHVSIEDYQIPPVNNTNLTLIQNQYKQMQAPVLIHCGAGQDRTGQVIESLLALR